MADRQGSKLCGILIFVGEANKITECGSAGIGRQARLRILWVYARVGSSPISRSLVYEACMKKVEIPLGLRGTSAFFICFGTKELYLLSPSFLRYKISEKK